MTTRVTVVGAGSWGTALACVLGAKGIETALCARREALADEIRARRENPAYLPGVAIPACVEPTADLGAAVGGADAVLVVVPSHGMRETARAIRGALARDALVVCATKGIETDSLATMSEVLSDEIPGARLAFLSGPSFAREVAAGVPTAVVVASRDEAAATEAAALLATPRFRVYTSDDVVGVEMGGALKNVIALAAGAVDGLGLGHNTRAALITRGLAEISRLAVRRGAHPLTLAGLAGLGDLVLTCTGDLSRNRGVGMALARGKSLDEVLAATPFVAEGVRTTRAAHELARRLDVEMPITAQVHAILYEGKDPRAAVHDLMTRELRAERDLA